MKTRASNAPQPGPSQKQQAPHAADLELIAGRSVELLKELHILTREGRLNQDSRRKLKQIDHLLRFIEELLKDVKPADSALTLVDHGAGKSYLGFLLYDRFFAQDARANVIGVEARAELVDSSRRLAERLGFRGMSFVNGTVAQSTDDPGLPSQVHIVTALHACDTATDDAIMFALRRKAQCIVLVPCCQAEVARLLSRDKALALARNSLSELWRHPLHTREFGSQLTNVLRCLYLEAWGYHVSVTELVGWEHSLKNELIIGRYTGQLRRSAAQRLREILEEFGLGELLHTRFALPGHNSTMNVQALQ
jgi:hypothetical protein